MSTYLITQATGQQSQMVISHLLAAGAKVHAVVRNLQKVPESLKRDGITLFQGDSTNLDSIFQAAQGCEAAYLNTFPWPGLEAQQAKTIVEACKKAGIDHIVGSTTYMTADDTMWNDDGTKTVPGMSEYFASKREVEDAVRAGNFKSYTILRPSVIMTDFMLPGVRDNFPGMETRAEIDHGCDAGIRMPFTDTYDIGRYAAAALQDPAKFGNQEIDLGNEQLTMGEVRDIIARVTGREDITVRRRTPAEVEEAMVSVFGVRIHLWANTKDFSPYSHRAGAVQEKFGIPFTSFEEAMTRDKARLLETLPALM